ncbi:MAG TPA: hypothetical protein DCZ95_17765 [Verrucomicrobia bacterium]|nr:MAG: hypothetical protein A2X46_07445 [Lentisphaerae bacterium GWF2_57_35]HBA85934.1 hypothetical protein [Verrucomicrobiota bacterium]
MGKSIGIFLCLAGTVGAFIALTLVGWQGGYEVNTGTFLDVLTAHSYERPLIAFFIFLPLLMLQADKPNALRFFSSLSLKSWFFLLFLIVLAAGVSTDTRGLYGDGREYILQTQSIALNGSLAVDREKAAAYWNRTNPYGIKLEAMPAKAFAPPPSQGQQAGGGFGGLYPDRFGQYRYYHAFLYSAAAAPLYKLLHAVFPNTGIEYDAFRYANLLLLCLPFVLAWRHKPSWALLIVLGLAVFSPLIAYVQWQHAEIFCFSMTVSSFLCVRARRGFLLSPLLLGLAAAQNLPVIFFFLPLAILVATQRRPASKAEWLRWSLAFGGGVSFGLLPLLYFQHYFGVTSLISALGLADLRFASASKVFDMFFSPLVGAFWSFPVCFLFIPSAWRKKNVLFLLSAVAAMLAGAFLASSTSNFMSGQVWAIRYMVWLLGPLWFFCLDGEGLPSKADGLARQALFVLGVLVNIAMINIFGMSIFWDETECLISKNWRTTPAVAAVERTLRYREDPEALAESILHRELPRPSHFDGLYVWNLGPHSSLWLISKRALESGGRFAWLRETVPVYRAWPRDNLVFVGTNQMLRLNPALHYEPHALLGDYAIVFVDDALIDYRSEIPVQVR